MIGQRMGGGTGSTSEYALAFETSGAVGSVAIGCGAEVLESRVLSGPKAHAVEFPPTVQALCDAQRVHPSSIRRVYVSVGPGSFTGLRIGVTAARMLAFATGAKVVAVPTLEVIAQNALDHQPPPPRVAVVLDAKRQRVYTATFVRQGGVYVATSEPMEADPQSYLSSQAADCAVLGDGVPYHRAAIEAAGRLVLPDSLHPPRAETVYRLGYARAERGEFVAPRDLVPTYIRPPEAEEVWARKHPLRELEGTPVKRS